MWPAMRRMCAFMKDCRHILCLRLMLGLAPLLVSGCMLLPHSTGHTEHHHAFIDYWAPPKDSQGLKLAVKDNIDMQGVVTTAGSGIPRQEQPARETGCALPGHRAAARRDDCRQDELE